MKLIGSRKLTWVICGTGVLLALAGVVFCRKWSRCILQME